MTVPALTLPPYWKPPEGEYPTGFGALKPLSELMQLLRAFKKASICGPLIEYASLKTVSSIRMSLLNAAVAWKGNAPAIMTAIKVLTLKIANIRFMILPLGLVL